MPTAFRHVNCQLVVGGMATEPPDITIFRVSNIMLEQKKIKRFMLFFSFTTKAQEIHQILTNIFKRLSKIVSLYTQDKYYSSKLCLRKLVRIFC